MKERRLSSICPSILPLEYQEAGDDPLALPKARSPIVSEEATPVVIGVPEEEVDRRIQIARDSAITEADQRIRIERERVSNSAHEKVAEVLKKFDGERAEYFRRVEGEVVQLALAIARKILQREAELDPTLLIALVKVALDRMQCGSVVRVRVASENVDLWRRCGDTNSSVPGWEIIADETLSPNDCVVETELGTANFGFEAQLRDVQESLAQLLAHRPATRSRHAAGV
jgi:flagellar assembly protein FliH